MGGLLHFIVFISVAPDIYICRIFFSMSFLLFYSYILFVVSGYINSSFYKLNNGYLSLLWDLSFSVANDNFDVTPPIVHDVQIDRQTVEAPGVVTVTVNMTDDLSGVNYFGLVFRDEAIGKNYSVGSMVWKASPTDIYKFEIEIGAYDHPGNFVLTSVNVTDFNDNTQNYILKPTQSELMLRAGLKVMDAPV